MLTFSHTPQLRSKDKVEKFRTNLMLYHDELADLKSYFDGQGNDAFDEKTVAQVNYTAHITCVGFRHVVVFKLACTRPYNVFVPRKVKGLHSVIQRIEVEPQPKMIAPGEF